MFFDSPNDIVLGVVWMSRATIYIIYLFVRRCQRIHWQLKRRPSRILRRQWLLQLLTKSDPECLEKLEINLTSCDPYEWPY